MPPGTRFAAAAYSFPITVGPLYRGMRHARHLEAFNCTRYGSPRGAVLPMLGSRWARVLEMQWASGNTCVPIGTKALGLIQWQSSVVRPDFNQA